MDTTELHERIGVTSPFRRNDWTGRFVSLDGADASDFTEADVAEVIAFGERDHGGGWEGDVAAVLRLNDGRFVSYETFWGPTGDGFSYDAYGGEADLNFASTLETVVTFGLTDLGRTLCGLQAAA